MPHLRALMLLAVAAFALSGCGNDPYRVKPGEQVRQVFDRFRPAPPKPTAAQIRANITPEVRAQLGNVPILVATLEKRGAAAALITVGQNGPVSSYSTPDGTAVSLSDGVLVATRGLGHDLMRADVSQIRAALRNGGGRGLTRVHHYLDGENHTVIRSYICDISSVSAGRLQEICHGPDLTFENSYVLGAGHAVASSRQWVGPENGYIIIEPSVR